VACDTPWRVWRELRDDDSASWLQRKHFRIRSTGFATVGEAAAAQECEACEEDNEVNTVHAAVEKKIKARMAEGRDEA